MVGGILDGIFAGLAMEKLNKEQVYQYLQYLGSLHPHIASEAERISYYVYQSRLIRRLQEFGS